MSSGERFLVSNYRELISCLEGLRVPKHPGRGLSQLPGRPVINAPLRTSEAEAITGGITGEFPVMISVAADEVGPAVDVQERSIPLDRVRAIVFQTEEHRDRLINRSFDNASPEGLLLHVDSAIFGGDGPTRFDAAFHADHKTASGWARTDSTCGAIAALLALADQRPQARQYVTEFINGTLPDLNLADVMDAPSSSPMARSLVQVMRKVHAEQGHDPALLLDQLAEALADGGLPPEEVARFHAHVTGILNSDRVRRKGALSDDKNVVLRALLLVTQRETVLEVADDRIGEELPGLRVHIIALALAGLREGLAHLPASLKNSHRAVLGLIAAELENGETSSDAIGDLLRSSGADGPSPSSMIVPERSPGLINALHEAGLVKSAEQPETWLSVPGSLPVKANEESSLQIGVTFWKPLVVKRALAGLREKPEGWRLHLDKNEHLWLEIRFGKAEPLAAILDQARVAIQTACEWVKPKRTRTKRSRKSEAPELPLAAGSANE